MEKISGVYKITNTVTKDFYIGSSKNAKRRWTRHKCQSTWKEHPNSPLYQDMQKYGIDKFDFQILANVEPDQLKETEQQFIETLKPTYNCNRAKGWDVESYKKQQQCYCYYSGKTLTFNALVLRFYRSGIEHPALEAKKYLLVK